MKSIMVSGGFDPLHVGHLRMLKAAYEITPKVIVALNSDAWLMRKKGYVFMPWTDRAEILRAINYIREVIMFDDGDETACMALLRLKPNFFGNGGDRKEPNAFEHKVCKELGITEVFNLGGGKARSSSKLVGRARGEEN